MIYSAIASAIGLLLIVAGFKNNRSGNKKSSFIDYGIGGFLIILASINSFVISPFKIPSESMIPVLNVGDFVIVKKFGDINNQKDFLNKIIVYKDPRDNDTYVKRIVGIPGDVISWDGSELKVNGENKYYYKDGCELIRPKPEAIYSFMSEDNIEGSWLVQKGLFSIGTNICHSMDSRSYGEIPLDNVIGAVIGVCGEKGCRKIREAISDKY